MCNDKDLQELLPLYLENALDKDARLRIEVHLKSCEDCRAELSLLREMSADSVPDPGEAYWAAMPGRVYQGVQQEKAAKKHFDLSWLLGRVSLPRWVLAAAAASIAVVISLSAINTLHQTPSQPQEYVFSDATPLALETMNIAALDQNEMSAAAIWTGEELAAIGQEVEPIITASTEIDIYEELAELNSREEEQLAVMLDRWNEEEQS